MSNKTNVFTTLAASNHSNEIREENDYYATEPKAVEMLLNVENFAPEIWECACGEGHISKVLENHGYHVKSTDLINRGYGTQEDFFLHNDELSEGVDIITNPPYKCAQKFVEKALNLIQPGNRVAMLLRIQFLEGKSRYELFQKYPPKKVYVFSSRVNCAKNGEFEKYPSSAVCFAWFIWEKGFDKQTTIDWLIEKSGVEK